MNTKSISSRVLKTEPIHWERLEFLQDEDFKEWFSGGDEKLLNSILKYQFIDPFKVWESEGKLYCLDGKHRWKDLMKVRESGVEVPDTLPATFIDCADKKEAAELVLVYSSAYARITENGLLGFFQKFDLSLPDIKSTLNIPDFDLLSFESSLRPFDEKQQDIVARSLQERFVIPPFSIFDSRQGYWQDRKKQWLSLGFNSQETREDVELVAKSGQAPAVYELRNQMRGVLGRDPSWEEILEEAKRRKLYIYEGASIFDPVLAEVCYRWFIPSGGNILDPFAGGSVRGIVAGILGFEYLGIDLRPEQVDVNIKQWDELKSGVETKATNVHWLAGDSNTVLNENHGQFDFIFSCPPYFDLEKYSDDPADLSNMDYITFCEIYRSIITKSIAMLKQNRFACFVVGDIRDKDGFYRDFVGETIRSFQDAGAILYNEIILVNVAGSLPVRIGRQFEGYRKVGKMHQNVLVFYKGDPKKIKEEFPEITVEEIKPESASV